LSWLRIELQILFWFAFYEDILVSWLRSQVLVFLPKLNRVNFFMRVYRFHDPSHKSFNIEFAFYWVFPIAWPMSRIWRINSGRFF
jgi:hypothetical protein